MHTTTTPTTQSSGGRAAGLTRVVLFAAIALLTVCVAWIVDRWAHWRERRLERRSAAVPTERGEVAVGLLGALVVALAWIAVGPRRD